MPARKDLTFLVQHNEDESNRLYVFFPDTPNVDSEDVGSYCEKMQAGRVMRGIIAVQKKITPMAVQGILSMAPKYILERFQESELMFNITKHHVSFMVIQQMLVDSHAKRMVLIPRASYTLSFRDSEKHRVAAVLRLCSSHWMNDYFSGFLL